MPTVTIMVNKDNMHIHNSYVVKTNRQMREYIASIRRMYTVDDCRSLKRSDRSIINEWRGHNCLYELGISVERTRCADIQADVAWYEPICYAVLSVAYSVVKLFHK